MMEGTILQKRSTPKQMMVEPMIYNMAMILSLLSLIYLFLVSTTDISLLPLGVSGSSSERKLAMIQCFLGMLVLQVPAVFRRITGIKLPNALSGFFYVFVLCGTVLGEMCSLYYRIPVWDSLLHFSSGIMAGMVGSILLIHGLEKKGCGKLISPLFIAAAALCFALGIGVVWEIYEFAGDALLGLNMQKSMLQDGTELVGKLALVDTMKDLIVDSLGAVVAGFASYRSLKQKKGWLYGYLEQEQMAPVEKTYGNSQSLPFVA